MKVFQTVVGIDPSGGRLAAVAMGGGLGRPGNGSPIMVYDLKAGSVPERMAEAGEALREFVAKNGLTGCTAKLCIPADRVYVSRVAFPPLREKDVRPALSLELERLFPVPPQRLRFAWRPLGKKAPGRAMDLVVTAASSDYIEQWREAASAAGLRLTGAVPAGSALAAAASAAGMAGASGGVTAVLRDAGGYAECTLLSSGEPFFLSLRPCRGEAIAARAFSLAAEGMSDAPGDESEGVTLIAPSDWSVRNGSPKDGGRIPYRPVAGAEDRIAETLGWKDVEETRLPIWDFLGAFGAAVSEKGIDLLDPEKERAGSRIAVVMTSVLALAAVLFGMAWPATVAFRAQEELGRLDAEVARLQPAAARVEKAAGDLEETGKRIATLADASAGRDEMLAVLLDLTERLPQGTWLTGLRVENRKVEMDGMSPSASEIFPLLAKDGAFRSVEFASPITRQGGENLERFQIRAECVRARSASSGGSP